MEQKSKRNWNENNLTKIKYQSHKRRNYCIETLDNGLYILAYNHSKEEGFMENVLMMYHKVKDSKEEAKDALNNLLMKNYISDSENLIYKGGSVFDSLISLRQKLDFPNDIEYYVNQQTLCELEKSISEKDKRAIIKWLEIYGMPFLGDSINEGIESDYIGNVPFCYGFTNDAITCMLEKACICRLGSFLIALNTIYTTMFLCLKYLYRIDKDSNINLDVFRQDKESDSDIIKKIYAYDLIHIESYIKLAFSSISIKNVFNIDTILYKNKMPKPEAYAETLISLAMYQLLTIVSSRKIYSVNRCKYCNNVYVPTRENHKYCMDCSRQKEWNKKHKQKS